MPCSGDWQAVPAPPALEESAVQWFAALGVGVVLTLKSAELSPVSCPSGRRTSLLPGAAELGGAGAAVPRTKAFVAVP